MRARLIALAGAVTGVLLVAGFWLNATASPSEGARVGESPSDAITTVVPPPLEDGSPGAATVFVYPTPVLSSGVVTLPMSTTHATGWGESAAGALDPDNLLDQPPYQIAPVMGINTNDLLEGYVVIKRGFTQVTLPPSVPEGPLKVSLILPLLALGFDAYGQLPPPHLSIHAGTWRADAFPAQEALWTAWETEPLTIYDTGPIYGKEPAPIPEGTWVEIPLTVAVPADRVVKLAWRDSEDMDAGSLELGARTIGLHPAMPVVYLAYEEVP
jgi:hypothetical protein